MVRFPSFWPSRPLRFAIFGMVMFAASMGNASGTPITLQFKWFHQFQFAGYYAAEAQGYYRAAGLDVHFKEGTAQIRSVDEVLSGRAQFGITDTSLLIARAEGKPVVAIGSVFQHSADILAVHLQGPNQGLKDLAGKRVMVSAEDADILAFLRKEGLPPERLNLVPHSFNIQDLIKGRVDAMTAYSTTEIYDLDRAGFPYQVYSSRTAGVDFYGDTLFTDEKEIREHPDVVKAFRDASMRGWQYAMAHQEEMVDLILSQYGGRMSRERLQYEANQMVPLLQPELVEMGYMNPERWKRIGDIFVSLGMLRKDYSLEGFLYHPRPEMDLRKTLRWIGILLVLGAAVFAYQIQRSNSRFRAIFNAANDAIFIHDPPSGAILDVNQRATEMYGYTRDEIRSLPFDALCSGVPPHKAEDALAWMRKAAEGPPQVFEWQAKDRSGRLFWVEVNMRRTKINGHARLVVSVRDIADRKAAEETKARLQYQLVQSQKMESLGVLAGGIAHDMNNVLGAILALASASQERHPQESLDYRAFATICQAAARGGQMVQSMLKFARQAPTTLQVLDANDILRDVADLLAHTTLATIELRMDLDPGLRPLFGDASALTHAFMNLCVNSVDAMNGKGVLSLATRNRDDGWIEVALVDSGCGMPQEILARAMEPFFTTKPVGKGTGLGLSIVYATVMAHHGQIDIHSEPGQGTRVVLRFPACEDGIQVAAAATIEATLPPRGTMKVLLVDDDELVQISVRTILEALGHAVATAKSGEEALAMLEAGSEPDLVILDVNMPGLGGAGTLPRLRGLRPVVPVILSTGRVDQTALTLASNHPGVILLSKPFGLRELQKRLEDIGLG